jgi:antitoxin component YwqK of YwqJK toxin-antitoxin module
MNKLEGFPTVFYVTLEEDIERQNLLTSAFKEYNNTGVLKESGTYKNGYKYGDVCRYDNGILIEKIFVNEGDSDSDSEGDEK